MFTLKTLSHSCISQAPRHAYHAFESIFLAFSINDRAAEDCEHFLLFQDRA